MGMKVINMFNKIKFSLIIKYLMDKYVFNKIYALGNIYSQKSIFFITERCLLTLSTLGYLQGYQFEKVEKLKTGFKICCYQELFTIEY